MANIETIMQTLLEGQKHREYSEDIGRRIETALDRLLFAKPYSWEWITYSKDVCKGIHELHEQAILREDKNFYYCAHYYTIIASQIIQARREERR